MANQATVQNRLELQEDVAAANELTRSQLIHSASDNLLKLAAATTPAVTKVYAQQLQLSSGTLTVDLTALVDGAGQALDLTGLKVQIIKIVNAPRSGAANTDTLNVVIAAVNGYQWAGDAASEATLAIGGSLQIYNPEGTPDVGASAKDITFSSPDVDADFQLLIAAG